jgi:hypothetical protein
MRSALDALARLENACEIGMFSPRTREYRPKIHRSERFANRSSDAAMTHVQYPKKSIGSAMLRFRLVFSLFSGVGAASSASAARKKSEFFREMG